MKNLTDIKSRMKTVTDTKKITGAMETISVAKMRKAMMRFENNAAFFKKIRSTISDIVLHTNCVTHRYLMPRKGSRTVFIVIASDKGLAGGFNHNVLNFALKKMKPYQSCHIFTVGQMAREFFQQRKMTVDVEFCDASFDPSMKEAIEIADSIIELYDNDMIDRVFLCYTKMENSLSMSPDMIQLLPLVSDELIEKRCVSADEEYYLKEIEYDPSPDDVLDSLIPQFMSGVIYGALIQSSASEHISRRSAMSNATKNATEILDDLQIQYNRARQEAVTTELSEIITAAMGVNND